MTKIFDIFDRPIDRRIEEVIKVDQTNEEDVYEELTEYVVTDSIKSSYFEVLDTYRETPQKPHEGVGIWISGFFGSGKSSFAKILGYILEGIKVKGKRSSEIFCSQTGDDRVTALLNIINEKIPTTSIIFDISTDRGVKTGSERITEVMYKVFLRNLGYSDDLKLAELEIGLESEGRLGEFEEKFHQIIGIPWNDRKKLTIFALSEASRVIREMDPDNYPHADSWAKAPHDVDISPNGFANRAMELAKRRCEGRTLVFVIDEVGQYVSRSTDKMLDLQGIVQAFGRVGKGEGWIVVTSQEALDQVVDNLEGRRVELARLQARFPIEINLSPADISEVTSKRVLTKKPQVETELKDLYQTNKGSLTAHTEIRSKIRQSPLTPESFMQLYPFMPYQIDLVIDIVSGLRSQPGASRQTGGSNRTIIKLAQQVVINPKVNLGKDPLGKLVTLDMVYDLVEGNVTYEKRKDIADITKGFPNPLTAKVAKAICLLQMVRGVPRTPENIAAALYPQVGHDSLLPQVKEAIEELQDAQKIKLTEEGYELLSPEGKKWEDERQGIEAKPAHHMSMRKEILASLMEDQKFRYKNRRTFLATIFVDGERVGSERDIPLRIMFSDPGDEFDRTKEEAKKASWDDQNALFWVIPITDEVYRSSKELHRSREMIARHERDIKTADEAKLLEDEKVRRDSLSRDLRLRLNQAILEGVFYFRRRETEIKSMGSNLGEVFRESFESSIPEMFSEFDTGAVPIKGNESSLMINAVNLAGLPSIFYDAKDGLGLVVEQAGKLLIDTDAKAPKKVLDFISQQHEYGEKVSGKLLENHFKGFGYGWDLELIMLLAATLFRGGVIELTYQGHRCRTPTDTGVKEVFEKIPAFRATSFAPRQDKLRVEDLVKAARLYEEIFGESIEIGEGVIATSLRKEFVKERERALPVRALLVANSLPGITEVDELLATCKGLTESSSDDTVKMFADGGEALKFSLTVLKKLEDATSRENLSTLQKARKVLSQAWPAIESQISEDDLKGCYARLKENIEVESFYDRLSQIASDAAAIESRYKEIYLQIHRRRARAYGDAIEEIKGHPEWSSLSPEQRYAIRHPLQRRSGLDQDPSETEETLVSPSIAEMESDLYALPGLRQEALEKIEEFSYEKVERVKISQFFKRTLTQENSEEFEEAIRQFRDYCLKLIQDGYRIIIE